MKYVKIGGSGLKVSELCLGTMVFGSAADENESINIIARAMDDGINFIDTANGYNNGVSESIVGKALKGKREQAVLVTKVNAATGPGPNDKGLSRYNILNAVEHSLKRLQTDHIDLYFLHRPDYDTPLEESLRAMDDLVRSGKVRYVGMSNHFAWQLSKALWLAELKNFSPVICAQDLYNMLNRDIELELLPFCRENGVGMMAYSPIARGVLTGKYTPNESPPADSRAARKDRRILETELRHDNLVVAQELKKIADDHGKSLSQIAVNWVISNPIVTSAVIGPRSIEQYEDNLGSIGWDITPELSSSIDALIPPGEHVGFGFNDPQNPVMGRPAG